MGTGKGKRKTLKKMVVAGGLAISSIAFFPAWASSANAPTLKLFPQDVRHYLKETSDNAKQLEDNLRGLVSKFDNQVALYKSSHCQDVAGDDGCEEIKSQIEKDYRGILSVMAQGLPGIKSSINSASSGLEKQISKRIGRNMKPRDIQRQLGDKATPKVHGSLSKRFSAYHDLISRNGSSSLIVMASEIYLDTSSAKDWVELIEADIASQGVVLDVFKMYGEISPEMINTLNGVKSIVFGEDIIGSEDGLPDGSVQAAAAESPWVIQ